MNEAFLDAWRAPLTVDKITNEVTYTPETGKLENVTHPAPLTSPGSRAIVSDRQVFDGSFIRLKNMNLGYTIPLKKNKSLRIYGTGQNLFTWTNYPGYDPEVSTYNKDPQRRGVDFGGYPGTKTISLGLKFNY